ncbi:uncharacterized protein LOC141680232 [Apium graveolens]|uniref:uncharacterized protein LOC141680232 n=1 Tax=Apium graveolens TaxID=4045 RepID=UPI003D795186
MCSRVRVTIDMDKPLKHRMKIKREGSEWSWVSFKYDRLSTFCFVCGILVHSDRDCGVVYAKPDNDIQRAYGTWLRAPVRGGNNQNLGAKWVRNIGESTQTWTTYGEKDTQPSDAQGGDRTEARFMEVDGKINEILRDDGGIRVVERNQEDRKDLNKTWVLWVKNLPGKDLGEHHDGYKNDEQGVWREEKEEIRHVVTTYFIQLFTSTGMESRLSERENVNRIIEEENNMLLSEVTPEEVKKAVFSLHPDKSPGKDRLNPAFFQSFRNIVGPDVFNFYKVFLNTWELPMEVFSNRLKLCLGSLISSTQSAFMEGRLLTNNALIASEVNHYIKRHTQGRNGVAGLKIDISKAYDRLEWDFIQHMMEKFGFNVTWISQIKKLIQTVSYSFLHDGYEGMSEKRINYTKLVLTCSPSTSAENCTEICQILEGWQNQSISRAGKVTLLKTAAQWGNGGTNRGIRWMSYERLCTVKEDGGLGFKSLRTFNVAMLAKQAWRLINNVNPLVTNLMRARRRIGDGLSTRIWKVPWVLCPENGCLTTKMPEELKDATVVGLLDEEKLHWDEEILNDLCNKRDREFIKQVPVTRTTNADTWFWLFDDLGKFTVRSCYRCLRGESECVDRSFWRKLWKLKLHGKVVNLVWRACRNFLPTCCFARKIWDNTGLSHVLTVMPNDIVLERRNTWVWQRLNISPFGVISKARTGWIKINTDAACYMGSNKVSVGCIIRDARGSFVYARSNAIQGTFHPREAEAVGLKEELSWGEAGNTYFHLIVEECRDILKHFEEVLVCFVHRSANMAAHSLAQVAYSTSGHMEWFDTAPSFLNCNFDPEF